MEMLFLHCTTIYQRPAYLKEKRDGLEDTCLTLLSQHSWGIIFTQQFTGKQMRVSSVLNQSTMISCRTIISYRLHITTMLDH